ncbi:MAG: hypothetical protein EZS28_031496 [Streblomastix strix]|uniref:Uncharacterized protein n=1 Tax=Streblomastix strix TaxID=222440 RepID=A0A5J4URF9_9EUKA|nr:MAG: hypothetical protein EZS28_031496 [Streblomastix strix]
MIKSDQINSSSIYRINQIKISHATFSNISRSGTGFGAAINALLQTGSQLLIKDSQFIQCKGSNISGGAIYLFIYQEGQVIISNSSFNQCEALDGGGIGALIVSSGKMIIDGQCNFTDCKAIFSEGSGGGICASIFDLNSQLTLKDGVKFERCTSSRGGGIYAELKQGSILKINYSQYNQCQGSSSGGGIYGYVQLGGKIIIDGQCNFTECKSTSGNGGGICQNIYDGTLNIEDATFDSCNCTQPGDGGALCIFQNPNSIISITNSSFINCKTISNSLDQSYGWGGAIRIYTSITAENLNESNFLIKDLIFIGCTAVNSIGNNIHIQSINTLATGEAIKNRNLLTVKDLSNPPNIISDLYTSISYAYDYMGINQSIQADNPGTTDFYLHNPLFEQSFTSNVPNPTYIDSINGKDIKLCGEQSSMCKTIKYSINRNPTLLSLIPPPDTSYSIIMTSNTQQDNNIQIKSTTLLNGNVIIQSNEYVAEAGNDVYNKQSISTSQFSSSLFTISETGHLSLLGLHFDNLNPSSTNPLISISTTTSNSPQLLIDDSTFDQSAGAQIYHSLIEMNGGMMTIQKTLFQNYVLLDDQSLINIKSDKTSTVIISGTSFISNKQSGDGNGSAINMDLKIGSQLTIKDGCSFIGCQSTRSGGAIYAVLNSGTTGGIFIEGTSKTSFSQCVASDQGGAIYLDVKSGVESKFDLSGVNYSNNNEALQLSLRLLT